MLLNKYSDFGGGKKSDSEFFSYSLMLNSGEQNSRVVRKKISERKKPHSQSPRPPPPAS